MKAITLYQPYASLIAAGAKRFETRSWATKHRGEIAIHAGKMTNRLIKHLNEASDAGTREAMLAALGAEGMGFEECLRELPQGAVIATAQVVGCYKITRQGGLTPQAGEMRRLVDVDGSGSFSYIPPDNELMFGDWGVGRYVWPLDNIEPFKYPVTQLGKQGLWNWGKEEKK